MQNIGELPDVCIETEPGIVDFKIPVRQSTYQLNPIFKIMVAEAVNFRLKHHALWTKSSNIISLSPLVLPTLPPLSAAGKHRPTCSERNGKFIETYVTVPSTVIYTRIVTTGFQNRNKYMYIH